MSEWYFWLAPIAVLAVFLLFRFVGCQLIFQAEGIDTGPYGEKILAEPGLVSYWRLHENETAEPPGPVDDNVPVSGGKANDEKQVNDGVYIAARIVANGTPPDTADAPGSLTLSAPGLLDIGDGSVNTSVQVDGGYVEVPFSNSLSLTSFSVEALVFPEWDPSERGLFRTVIAFFTVPFTSGFAIYSGPDETDPNKPYVWQVWLGNGTQAVRINFNHGSPPLVDFTKTNYIAVTYDDSTKLLNLYTYVAGINLDDGPFNPVHDAAVTYVPTTDPARPLLIGVDTGAPPLYPFKGRIQEIAVYNQALNPFQVISHIGSGLNLV